jgi:pimeloyl-ACP methyl ester carboxylesterase
MSKGRTYDEWQAVREYWTLRSSPVFRGQNLPRGNGQLVVLIPGLFANDLYLHTVNEWLTRLGYKTLLSSLRLNVGCPKRLIGSIESSIEKRLQDHTGAICVVGHSRGGLFAKVLAHRIGDRVKRLVLVGSPLGAMMAAGPDGLATLAASMGQSGDQPVAQESVFRAGRNVTRMVDPDCASPECGCAYMKDLLEPLAPGLAVTSIYSTEDPIVAPEASVVEGATNIRVQGTHSGLMFNRDVYVHLAEALAS